MCISTKKSNTIFNKTNKEKNSFSTRISVPYSSLKEMGISENNKKINLFIKRKGILINSEETLKHYKQMEKDVLNRINNDFLFEDTLKNIFTNQTSKCWVIDGLIQSKRYFYSYNDVLEFLKDNALILFETYIIELWGSTEEYFKIAIRFDGKKPIITEKGKEYLKS